MPGTITIELEREDARYAPGETVAGVACVDVQGPGIETLEVNLEHAAEGSDTRASDQLVAGPVSSGPFREGKPVELPFSFELPATVRPFVGELFLTEVRIVAELDGPKLMPSERPRAQLPLVIDGPARGYDVQPIEQRHPATTGRLLARAVGLMVLGAMGVGAAATTDVGFFAAIGAITFILGGLGVLLLTSRWLAERKTGTVLVSLETAEGGDYRRSGVSQRLRCVVRSQAKTGTATVTLQVDERTSRGSGDTLVSRTHRAYEATAELEEESPGVFAGQLPLPDAAQVPADLSVGRHRVTWHAKVAIDVPDAPAWEHYYSLDVRPMSGA